jgi:hypothetical protein
LLKGHEQKIGPTVVLQGPLTRALTDDLTAGCSGKHMKELSAEKAKLHPERKQ